MVQRMNLMPGATLLPAVLPRESLVDYIDRLWLCAGISVTVLDGGRTLRRKLGKLKSHINARHEEKKLNLECVRIL